MKKIKYALLIGIFAVISCKEESITSNWIVGEEASLDGECLKILTSNGQVVFTETPFTKVSFEGKVFNGKVLIKRLTLLNTRSSIREYKNEYFGDYNILFNKEVDLLAKK